MNAENKSASLVSQLKFSERSQIPQGYYRSKLFIASSPTNPLLAAAGPIAGESIAQPGRTAFDAAFEPSDRRRSGAGG